jgi:hypothetical protein
MGHLDDDSLTLLIPVGESPTGTGESPVLPSEGDGHHVRAGLLKSCRQSTGDAEIQRLFAESGHDFSLLLQEDLDGLADGVNRLEVELGFDGHFLADQILGHSP